MKLLRFALAAASLSLAAAGSVAWRDSRADASPKPEAAPAVTVRTADARKAKMRDVYVAYGTFAPRQSVDIPARASGQLTAILVKEGQDVAAGDLIAQIDDSLAQANLANSQALLALAQAKYDRLAKLETAGVSSVAALDEAKSALLAAQSDLALRRSALEFLKIRAPFAGRVAARPPVLGSYLQAGQMITRLVDVAALEAEFSVPFDLAGGIAVGAKFDVEAIGPVAWTAEAVVSAVSAEVDPATRTVRLRGRIDNRDGAIRPGSIARIALITAERPDSVTVPEAAVISSLSGAYLYRVVDGRALRTPVVTGSRRDGTVEIRKGLAAGEIVVTDGRQKLKDGAAVLATTEIGAR